MSSWYQTCPHCGANLDPFEVCDCQKDLEPTTVQQPMPLEEPLEIPVITNAEQFLELIREDWSNNAALGYAIRAMKNSALPEETIQEVVNEMNWAFDVIGTQDAAKIYEKSNY